MAKAMLRFRQLMEQAVEVMRQSVAEPRSDGKASPLVGAVLVRPDGDVITACRGELRNGDHAEYTLLERKQRDQLLDGAILFATLEPCASGCRRHPKLGCAERIVLARIKEVYVGIEDPDPTVDRAGSRPGNGPQRAIPQRLREREADRGQKGGPRHFVRPRVAIRPCDRAQFSSYHACVGKPKGPSATN